MNQSHSLSVRRRIEIVALVAVGVVIGMTITGIAVAAATVGSASIKNNAVLSRQIKAGQVLASDIRRGAVTGAKIAPGAVSRTKLANGAVGNTKIAAGAVGPSKIAAGAVGTAQIGNGSVATADIADGAVTAAKLGAAIGAIAPATPQNTGSGNPEVMELGATTFDSAGMHSDGVDSILVTVAGMYEVCALLAWNPAASMNGVRQIDIRKNSAELHSQIIAPASMQLATMNTHCIHAALAVGDVIDVQITQTSGAPLFAGYGGQLSVMRIGAAA